MSEQSGRVVSVHIGTGDDMSKQPQTRVEVEQDGFAGDKHRGFTRIAYDHDKDPEGTVRRNERQWSGVSLEELEQLSASLDLPKTISAEDLGANLCIAGIDAFSALKKGTRLKFSSGAVLAIEEYNPPCKDMGEKIADLYAATDAAVQSRDFVKAAARSRGVVGVVEVPGMIAEGDDVIIEKPWEPKF
ncbi:MAG: MOSC domain-containing protein [Pseudomonadota bacterium]